MEETSLIEYLKIAESHFEREKEKAERVFTWAVNKEMIRSCKGEMLIKPLEKLLQKGKGILEFLE
jgi:hypothetical protein